MAKLEIMDHTGHTTLEYGVDEAEAIKNAERAFNEAIGHSIAFAVDDATGDVKLLKKFDESEEHIVMAVPMVGG